MQQFYGFITPCSNGTTLGGCPYSNYHLDLEGGDVLVPELVETYVPIVGKDGCIKCPYLKFQDEVKKLEELA